MSNQFVTAINCMDGRVQEPVIKWMKEKYNVTYVDMITEAGPNKTLLYGTDEDRKRIRDKVDISYHNHGSKVLAIVGHHDCAGYSLEDSRKKEKIKSNVQMFKDLGYEMEIIGLFVNADFEVEVVVD